MLRFIRFEISKLAARVSGALVQATDTLHVASASLNRFERWSAGRRPA